ncbi:MAG: Putative Anion-selective porin [Nitrospira sp.]|nr:MAG: Putative Anion-selective porin [Nitrospira sp.]
MSYRVRWLAAGWLVLLGFCLGPAWAADTGTLVEKDGRYVFVESMDPATKLLLQRAVTQGTITQEEYDHVVKESQARTYLLQPSFKAWYDRGFNFSMNDNDFFLKIRGRFAARYTQRYRNEAYRNSGDSKNFPELLGVFGDYRASRSGEEASTFNLRTARIYFMGHLFNPDFKYYIQLAGETAENAQAPGALSVFDMNVTSTHIPWLNVQVGQYKVYFSRSQINSTASMQFATRALAMDAFTANGLNRRDVGITIMNDEEIYPVTYYFGVFNGAGPLVNRFAQFSSEEPTLGCPGGQTGGNPFPSPSGCPTNQRSLNANLRSNVNQLMYVARLQANLMGRAGYGEGDMAYSETPQLAVGGAYAYNPSIDTSTNNAFVGIDLANLSVRRQLAALGNGRMLGQGVVDFSTWTLDSVFKYRGFSLQAEYWFRNVIRHNKELPCMQTAVVGGPCTVFAPGQFGNSTGWYVQSGYYLIPRKVEVAARYAWWDPDTRSGGDLIKEVDVSLNWFLGGTYDHQIMLTYSNTAMGQGGFAIGRSAPLPAVGAAFPSGTVPLDRNASTLIENAVRLNYQIFF